MPTANPAADVDPQKLQKTSPSLRTEQGWNVMTVIVDTHAGVRVAWSPELNKPMPNATSNVVAQVDGGLQNTFTLKMDGNGHLASAKGHVVSTLVGDMNRNGYQQRKAGWLDGPGYDGGHAAPSFFGFIGERGGLFPQHEWQNRGFGIENDDANFHEIEMDIIKETKTRLEEGSALDLAWEMELLPGPSVGVPATTRLTYAFGADEPLSRDLNNLGGEVFGLRSLALCSWRCNSQFIRRG